MFARTSTLVGGVLAVAIGTADAFLHQAFGLPVDLVFIAAGLAALGVHPNLP